MSLNRRDFIRSGTLAAAATALPRGLIFPPRAAPFAFDDDQVRHLARRALDAATAAGARHAEVRLSHLREWRLGDFVSLGGGLAGTTGTYTYGTRTDALAVGVRALVGGAWGFASGTLWSEEEAARLGTAAVAQARTTARAGMPPVELIPAPVVQDARWSMPVERDPFSVSREEVLDSLNGNAYYTLRRWGMPVSISLTLSRLESAFASTEGSYLTQVRFATGAGLEVGVRPQYQRHQYVGPRPSTGGRPCPRAGRGWEYIAQAPWYGYIERLIAEQEKYLALPAKAVEVGRYDVVFDQYSTAHLLSGTIGTATELDRAMGYEANAGGTSYLNDPVGMLGREPVAAPLVTVSANRSLPGGLATVKWDEEGVAPEEFTLVKDGLLADFQTTRDSAPWLKERYAALGRPLRSHGCAGGATALDVTQLQRPNLRLTPGTAKADFAELIARMGNGVAVESAGTDIDFNALNGMARLDPEFPVTRFYEVKRGKKVARLFPQGTAVLFRAPELWKSVVALGGTESVHPIPIRVQKGEPTQETWHTVEAPPILVRQMAVIDPTR